MSTDKGTEPPQCISRGSIFCKVLLLHCLIPLFSISSRIKPTTNSTVRFNEFRNIVSNFTKPAAEVPEVRTFDLPRFTKGSVLPTGIHDCIRGRFKHGRAPLCRKKNNRFLNKTREKVNFLPGFIQKPVKFYVYDNSCAARCQAMVTTLRL